MAEKRLCYVEERGPREIKIIGRKRSRQADDDNPGAREKCPFAEIILGIDDLPHGDDPEDHPPSDLYASTGQPACYKTLFFNVPKKWYYIHPSNGFYFGFNYKMKGPCELEAIGLSGDGRFERSGWPCSLDNYCWPCVSIIREEDALSDIEKYSDDEDSECVINCDMGEPYNAQVKYELRRAPRKKNVSAWAPGAWREEEWATVQIKILGAKVTLGDSRECCDMAESMAARARELAKFGEYSD